MFFDKFLQLCKLKGVTPNKALTEMGIARANQVRWKNGTMPSSTNLKTVAEYFGVKADDLISDDTRLTYDSKDMELHELNKALFRASEEQLAQLRNVIKAVAPELFEDE